MQESSRGRRFVRNWSVANDNAVQQTTTMMKWLQRRRRRRRRREVKWRRLTLTSSAPRRAIDQLQRGVWVNYMYFSRQNLVASPAGCLALPSRGHIVSSQVFDHLDCSAAHTQHCFMRTLWRNQQTAEIGRVACRRQYGFNILVSSLCRWHRFLLVLFTGYCLAAILGTPPHADH